MKKFLGDFGSKKVFQIEPTKWILEQNGKQIDSFDNKMIYDHWKLYSGFKEQIKKRLILKKK
jgi:hypothetical protein